MRKYRRLDASPGQRAECGHLTTGAISGKPSGRYVQDQGESERCRGRGWICRGHTIGIIAKPSRTASETPPAASAAGLTPPRIGLGCQHPSRPVFWECSAKEAPCTTFTSAAPVCASAASGLGTMNFGPSHVRTRQLSDHGPRLDLGINFFDSANVYGWKVGEGVTEQIVGALAGSGRRTA